MQGTLLLATIAGWIALVCVLVTGPRTIAWLRRLCPERIDVASPRLRELHGAKAGTPTLGGVLFVAASLLATAAVGGLFEPAVLLVALAMVAFGLVGAWDDVLKIRRGRGVTPRGKLLAQFAVAVPLACGWLCLAPQTANAAATVVLASMGTVWLVGMVNAVNVTDGLDGLAAGCGLVAAVILAIVVAVAPQRVIGGSPESAVALAVMLIALAGGLAGFLRFNLHPAQVFMGNAGAAALGAVLAMSSLVSGQALALLLAGGVFVVEAASVLVQVTVYKLTGRRVLRCAPLHHHFQFGGWKEPVIVRRFFVLALVGGLAALTSAALRGQTGTHPANFADDAIAAPSDSRAVERVTQDARPRQVLR
ncbi:MAG: phospho-N-acetylmuramoyl-pentapeptide-transferase [Pirellulales bacterium]|nr:phospho-N-acetylmuramoyl-pentapeptide-transferase [Pirellulales bacterium]